MDKSNIIYSLFCLLFLVSILLSCENANNSKHKSEQLLREAEQAQHEPEESNSRDIWQKPQLIINLIGKNKVVADIGAEFGYWSFKLLPNAKKIIGIDIDDEMIALMDQLVKDYPKELANKFEARLALPNDPKIEEKEVDVVLIVNTIAYISNRVEYLQNLIPTFKNNGEIIIIDWKIKRLPHGDMAPPYEEREYLNIIEEELYQAGYKDIKTDDTSLEYQYIIKAKAN